jgi:hypothetical protein
MASKATHLSNLRLSQPTNSHLAIAHVKLMLLLDIWIDPVEHETKTQLMYIRSPLDRFETPVNRSQQSRYNECHGSPNSLAVISPMYASSSS